MKLLSAQQIREWDADTISKEPIASIDLMERACKAFVNWFVQKYGARTKVGVVCGTGNNGGDGLGIARLLKEWGYPVTVWVVDKGDRSPDFAENLERLKSSVTVSLISSANQVPVFQAYDVLIDGLFGSGLNRPVSGVHADVIALMNSTPVDRVAIDVPSGLQIDGPSTGEIVRATYTVSFQIPKLAFLLPDNQVYVGKWTVVDIGLRKAFLKECVATSHYTLARNIKKLLRVKGTFDHKGTNGKALLVSGSLGKMGACILAARGALRSGVGLLTTHVPKCGYTIIQTAVPEAMTSVDKDEEVFSSPPETMDYQAVGVGPGLGQSASTVEALGSLMKNYQRPVVLDADALNCISKQKELLESVPKGSILTPHPGEFARLVGNWDNDFEKLELLRSLARSLESVVVLKGAYTAIASAKGDLHFNSTGNPGMAKGGSGDVLTGILTGLLAQGYDSLDAARIGVFLHGLAGDLAVREASCEGLIPSDMINFLPQAYRKLRQ